ncbi:MAG TPA: alanine racemase [Sulfurimonas sp.]|nr:alanine racemase [Sulfurimonas sp.]
MSYITLKKSAFFNNLDIISKKTGDIDKIALVLKDNAYGHGLLEVASMAKEYGISRAVVRREEEALLIQEYFKYILILSPLHPLSKNTNFVYVINDLNDISKFPANTRVELKIDTGMHRNGLLIQEIEEALLLIKRYELNLEAMFTHFRSADTMSAEWFWQKKNFEKIKVRYPSYRFHSCNSAAIFRDNNFNEDMVRIGIAAYGCLSLDKGLQKTGLEPVLSLFAQKISTRRLKLGHRVGYNATYEAKEEMDVSCFDIGYADGFPRLLSNNYTSPEGFELLGRVSMDNSSYKSDQEELLIFDDARELASKTETIGYEILTSLSPFIRRIIT